MPGWLGPWEIVIVVVILLVIFGPKRLPEMGRGLGKGMREFRDSVTGRDERKRDEAQAIDAAGDDAQAPGADAPGSAAQSSRERDSVA